MKKINVLIFFTLFFCAALFAQIPKGSLLIDGNFGINADVGNEDNNTLSVLASPLVGFFVNQNLVLGGRLSVISGFSDGVSGGTIGLFPQARLYFKNDETPLKWFGQAGFDFQFGYGDFESTTVNLDLRAGANLFINSLTAIEIALNFQERDLGGDFSNSNLFINGGLQFFLIKGEERDNSNILKKGRWFIGATTFGINLSTLLNSNDFFSIGINPNAGYFLSEQFAIALALPFNYATNNAINSLFQYGIQPQVRFYPIKQGRAFQPFFLVSTGIQWYSIDVEDSFIGNSEIVDNTTITSFNGGIGANLFLSQNVAFEGSLQYLSSNSDDLGIDTQNIGFNVGIQFFVK